MTNIRNQVSNFETCVSMKRKVKYLHETLGKFAKEKGNLDLILSIQRSFLNKTELGFKSGRSHIKGFNRNKVNHPIYKYSYCDKFSHLEPFCFN